MSKKTHEYQKRDVRMGRMHTKKNLQKKSLFDVPEAYHVRCPRYRVGAAVWVGSQHIAIKVPVLKCKGGVIPCHVLYDGRPCLRRMSIRDLFTDV